MQINHSGVSMNSIFSNCTLTKISHQRTTDYLPGKKIEITRSPVAQAVSADHRLLIKRGGSLDLDSFSQDTRVKPNSLAASNSLSVREDQNLMEDQGCCSRPESLSHVRWVYPNVIAAASSLRQSGSGCSVRHGQFVGLV